MPGSSQVKADPEPSVPTYRAAPTSTLPSTRSPQASIKQEDEDQDDLLSDEEAQSETSYKPRPPLSKPSKPLRTLAYLMQGLKDGVIDVNPEYQREVVWTLDRKTGLINSLMENYYIPPIILNKKPLPADNDRMNHTLVCVDGKQRLTAVQAFVNGTIPCHDDQGQKWWFCDVSGSRGRKILPEELRKEFLSKELVSFEYINLSPDQEEDLFARVQMGVQLTLAERMRATTGPWQELTRCFVNDFPTIYSLQKSRARAKDFQNTLSCFSQIVEVQNPTGANGAPTLKTTERSLYQLLQNRTARSDGLKSHLAAVWNTFQELIELNRNTFFNNNGWLQKVQTFAPIEMVAVTVLISMYSEKCDNEILIMHVQALRKTLRDNFTDLRMSARVWKFVWNFLSDLETNQETVGRHLSDRNVHRRTPSAALRMMESPVTEPVTKRGSSTAVANTLKGFSQSGSVLTNEAPESDSIRPKLPVVKRRRVETGVHNATSISSPSLAIAPSHEHILPRHDELSATEKTSMIESLKYIPFEVDAGVVDSTPEASRKIPNAKRAPSTLPHQKTHAPSSNATSSVTPLEARQAIKSRLISFSNRMDLGEREVPLTTQLQTKIPKSSHSLGNPPYPLSSPQKLLGVASSIKQESLPQASLAQKTRPRVGVRQQPRLDRFIDLTKSDEEQEEQA